MNTPCSSKSDSSGNTEWQKAYNGGIHCYFNGYNTTCVIITVERARTPSISR